MWSLGEWKILIAIDDLDDLIGRSPHLPLTNAVRIDAQVVREAAPIDKPCVFDVSR